MMRPIAPMNISKRPSPRVGPKVIAIPLSFDPLETDTNLTFRFDLTQEMLTGQMESPQTLYFDNTSGAVDVQLYFESTNSYMRFPLRTLCILPFLGASIGPVYARYQSANWNLWPGFPAPDYKPILYLLNVETAYAQWERPRDSDGPTVTRYSGTCTGGLASDLVVDNVLFQAFPETRVRIYIENPATETEPLFWNINGSASGSRPRLMPGEHIVLGEGSPVGGGSINVAATTAGHAYRVLIWSYL